MIIEKLKQLNLMLKDIASDDQFSLLGDDIQDNIEDLDFNLPMQIFILKEGLNPNVDNPGIDFTRRPSE